MLIWITLSLLVVFISFVLACRSMKNFGSHTGAGHTKTGVFLIQNPHNLTPQLLDDLHGICSKLDCPISFEKLFKGHQKAWVVSGDASILLPFSQSLGLLELEDYSQNILQDMAGWELTSSDSIIAESLPDSLKTIGTIKENEQLWLQLVLKPIKRRNDESSKFFLSVRSILGSAGVPLSDELRASFAKVKQPDIKTSDVLNRFQARTLVTTGEILAESTLIYSLII